MITKFKLFESNIQVDIDIPKDILNKLISTLSFIIYKGTKRNVQKHNNYKSLRIKSISGYYNDNISTHNGPTNDYLFNIEMTNKDKIEGKYTKNSNIDGLIENSIYVEINGNPVYNLDNEKYEINSFIDMIGAHYKKYINKKWKIK